MMNGIRSNNTSTFKMRFLGNSKEKMSKEKTSPASKEAKKNNQSKEKADRDLKEKETIPSEEKSVSDK